MGRVALVQRSIEGLEVSCLDDQRTARSNKHSNDFDINKIAAKRLCVCQTIRSEHGRCMMRDIFSTSGEWCSVERLQND